MKKIKINSKKKIEIITIIVVTIILASILVISIGYLVEMNRYEDRAIRELRIYQSNRYNDNFNCLDTTLECKEMFEILGLETQMLIGDKPDDAIAHCWLKVKINDEWFEFECVTLTFTRVSDGYINVRNYER